ncbi:LysM peptidoglycan-binding domain-containing protein [Gemmatimonas sp.]|uniref:LysM peptidoglycan-binding domain-containing protein n=1 Tax=Gemmatimonas sp. TaxID=1962908 RepID=UPI00286BD59D|nr:LysM peptidoglycan-binding domain-containing protein [Gemmatimonas sp.]
MAIHDPSANPVEHATAALDTAASAESAGAATSPRRAGWLRAGAAAPPARRQRSPWVRLLVALTSSTALLGTAGLVAAAAIVPPIGARRTAREAAQQEVLSQLGPDERVVARAFASQRRWTDMWRESFGVVVATNRRLLYVGAPPTPLLRPREDGPTELLVESYPFDAAFTLEPRTLFRGYGRGLMLRTPAAQVDFIVDDDSWTSALRVSQASAAARRSVTRDEEALSATTRAPAPPAALYVRYIVQRGETLTGLARRFRTSPDVLRQLNQLSTDEIKVGQRLRVPKVDLDTLP